MGPRAEMLIAGTIGGQSRQAAVARSRERRRDSLRRVPFRDAG
jgi:hypothetical protein